MIFWSVQLYKASGISDNAEIYSTSTFVEYHNQNIFADFFPKKLIFNIFHYNFEFLMIKCLYQRLSISYHLHNQIIAYTSPPGIYIGILRWNLKARIVKGHFICQSHEYGHPILIPFSIIQMHVGVRWRINRRVCWVVQSIAPLI